VGFDEWHGNARQVRPKRLKAHEKRAVDWAEEARDALHIENVNELIGGSLRLVRAERLVGELHERRLIVRRLHHAIELGLLATFLRRLQLPRAAAKLAGESECLLNFERGR
jgi:hypothetical protein